MSAGHSAACHVPILLCSISPSLTVPQGQERTFVRVLLLRGRVQGAVLIGDTGGLLGTIQCALPRAREPASGPAS